MDNLRCLYQLALNTFCHKDSILLVWRTYRSMTARPLPGHSGAGYLFGSSHGRSGMVHQPPHELCLGFAAFFAATFCAIVTTLIYSTATHRTVDFAIPTSGRLACRVRGLAAALALSGDTLDSPPSSQNIRESLRNPLGAKQNQQPGVSETKPRQSRVSKSFCYSSFLANYLEDHLVCHLFVPLCAGAVVRPPS